MGNTQYQDQVGHLIAGRAVSYTKPLDNVRKNLVFVLLTNTLVCRLIVLPTLALGCLHTNPHPLNSILLATVVFLQQCGLDPQFFCN